MKAYREPRLTGASGCLDVPVDEGRHEMTVGAFPYFSEILAVDTSVQTQFQVTLRRYPVRPQVFRVVDRVSGEAVDGVKVHLEWKPDQRGGSSGRGRTDADGQIVIEALADGEYWLGVSGQPRIEYHAEDLQLGPERIPLTVEVTVNPRVLVSGVVIDEEGRPVENARIRAARFKSKTWTDAAGNFEVYAIVTPRSFVTVQAPGFKLKSVPIVVHEGGERSAEDWDVVSVGEIVLERHP